MTDDRLPTRLEVSGLSRKVEAEGGFATILRKGDPDRGSILLVILARGVIHTMLERVLTLRGDYQWQPVALPESPSSLNMVDFLAHRARFDEDYWAVELDIADPERFIAETTALG